MTSLEIPPARRVALPSRNKDGDFALSVHELGPEDGPAVVLCHGFPDLACGWRAQMPAIAEAGFRVLAPDQRGYGASSCPPDVSDYGLTELTGDLIALLDACGIERAVFLGHDWGGFVVWAMAVLHPERVAGVGAVCTPYIPFPSVATHAAVVGGEIERQYVVWFQEPGLAESTMDREVREIFECVMRKGAPTEEVIAAAMADGKLNMNPFLNAASFPPVGEPVVDAATLDHYIETYEKTGFRGGINWYRNVDRNAAEHPAVGVQPLTLPCLMLVAERDPALSPALAEGMSARCSDLELHTIEGAGHWALQEKPEEVNAVMVSWLRRRFGAGGA